MAVTWTEVSADPGVDFTNYGNGSTITFTSVNGGVNIPSGVKFVMFVATHDSTTAITAQIGSQSLANAVEDSGGNNSVFWVDLASAQTDTITLSSCPAVQSISVLAGWLSNAAAGAPSFTGSSAAGAQQFATISLTIPNGGMAVGGMWEYNGTTSPTWSNMTQANFLSNAGPNKGQGSAFSAAGTGAAVTIGVSGGSSAFATSFVGASWAAAASGSNFTLAGAEGAFAISGKAAALNKALKAAGAEGSFTISGKAAAMLRGIKLGGAEGAFVINGQVAAELRGIKLAGAEGAFTINGQPAVLSHGLHMPGNEGAFTISGQSAKFPVALSIRPVTGVFTINGRAAVLTYTPVSGGASVSHSNPFFSTPGPGMALP